MSAPRYYADRKLEATDRAMIDALRAMLDKPPLYGPEPITHPGAWLPQETNRTGGAQHGRTSSRIGTGRFEK